MPEVFSLKLRYLCADCGYTSPRLKISPSGLCTRANLPVFHAQRRNFEIVSIGMSLQESMTHLSHLETLLADRQYEIDQKMEGIAAKRIRLLQALKEGHGHPRLKDGILTLNRQLESCERDKVRHARLLSEDIGIVKTHISRLHENGLETPDDGLDDRDVVLWPRPWTTDEKIPGVPCPECIEGVAREHMETS